MIYHVSSFVVFRHRILVDPDTGVAMWGLEFVHLSPIVSSILLV